MNYKKLMEGKKSSMTQSQIRLLSNVGFEWSIYNIDTTLRNSEWSIGTWDTRFKELQDANAETWNRLYNDLIDYKNTYGDCKVPQKWSANKQLGPW